MYHRIYFCLVLLISICTHYPQLQPGKKYFGILNLAPWTVLGVPAVSQSQMNSNFLKTNSHLVYIIVKVCITSVFSSHLWTLCSCPKYPTLKSTPGFIFTEVIPEIIGHFGQFFIQSKRLPVSQEPPGNPDLQFVQVCHCPFAS